MEALPTPKHPWVDASRAPLLLVRFPAVATNAEVIAFCEAIAEFWPKATQHYAWVADARDTRDSPAAQRRIFADYEKRHQPYSSRWHAGMAMVVRGRVARYLLMAIYWLTPPVYEHWLTEDIDAAWSWAEARLKTVAQQPKTPRYEVR